MGWRYETKSTIITTNRPIGPIAQLGLVLGDPMAATAIIDRLMQHCTAIAINGDSYRLKEHKLKNCLTDNLQAAKELKPEWHNCRGQDLSARGSTYLTVDNRRLHRFFVVVRFNLYPGDLTKPLIVMYLIVATDISPVARLTEPRIRSCFRSSLRPTQHEKSFQKTSSIRARWQRSGRTGV